MKLEYLREFVALARELNYTETAHNLYIAQPALSRHIASIEKELGCRLLERTTRKVTLTAAGVLAAEGFASVLRHFDSVQEQLVLAASGQSGKLSLGILYYAIEDHLDKVLKGLRLQHPDVELSVRSFQVPSLNAALLDGEIDVGLTFSLAVPADERLASVPLFTEPMIMLLSSRHRLAPPTTDKVSIRDFAEDRFVYMASEPWHKPYVEGLLERYLDKLPRFLETEQIDTLASAVVKHRAVALMPGSSRRMSWAGLAHLGLRERGLRIESSLVYRQDNRNPALQLLLQTFMS